MTAKDILAICTSILLSVGGSGVIICAISYFLSERIAKRIDSKYQHRLNQQLEKYKNVLDHKTHISRAQFDAEFQIYKELSKAYFAVIVKASVFSKSYQNSKTISQDYLMDIIDANGVAQDILFENEPFIPEEIFNEYLKLNEKTNSFFWEIMKRVENNFKNGNVIGEIKNDEDTIIVDELRNQLSEVNKSVRNHLESLSIIN